MNHQEIRLLLSAYIDDEVTDAERSTVDDHLIQCAECRRQVAQFVTLKSNVRSAGNIELPYAFASTLARSIYHDEELSVSWLGIEHYALRFVFGLAFLVLLLVGITSYNHSDDAVPLDRYVSGISSDSAVSQILTKQGTITRDDVMFAVLTK